MHRPLVNVAGLSSLFLRVARSLFLSFASFCVCHSIACIVLLSASGMSESFLRSPQNLSLSMHYICAYVNKKVFCLPARNIFIREREREKQKPKQKQKTMPEWVREWGEQKWVGRKSESVEIGSNLQYFIVGQLIKTSIDNNTAIKISTNFTRKNVSNKDVTNSIGVEWNEGERLDVIQNTIRYGILNGLIFFAMFYVEYLMVYWCIWMSTVSW